MIETLNVTNFRCFEHVNLKGLARFNVITGANASGKSALLEAIYLGSNANIQAIQNISGTRGMPMAPPVVPGAAIAVPTQQLRPISYYFDPLFRTVSNSGNVELAKKFSIGFTDSKKVEYLLDVHYHTGGTDPETIEENPTRPTRVDFDTRKSNAKPEKRTISITTNPFGQIQQTPAPPFGPKAFIFGSQVQYSENDDVRWFTSLKEKNKADLVISFIREEFPFIRDIEILAPNGVIGLYATMADGTRRRVSAVSTGIYKIVSILLATAESNGGVIVVDEIENGIYYEKYPAVWRMLYDFSKKTDKQVFISSHSRECLHALIPMLSGNEADFSLLRAEREEGKAIVRHSSGRAMEAALLRDGEIRGASRATNSDHE